MHNNMEGLHVADNTVPLNIEGGYEDLCGEDDKLLPDEDVCSNITEGQSDRESDFIEEAGEDTPDAKDYLFPDNWKCVTNEGEKRISKQNSKSVSFAENDLVQDKKAVSSLPHLQNLIKRDPFVYENEFNTQYMHFRALVEAAKIKSSFGCSKQIIASLHDLIMFLAQTSPCYSASKQNIRVFNQLADSAVCNSVCSQFSDILIDTVTDSSLPQILRKTIVNALILLRNKREISILKLLPHWIKLFTVEDKCLRIQLHVHIVKDIARIHQKNYKVTVDRNYLETELDKKISGHALDLCSHLKNTLFGFVRNPDETIKRKAIGIIIELYRRDIWNDDRTVNVVASGILSNNPKVVVAVSFFFLGHKSLASEFVASDHEDEPPDKSTMKLSGSLKSKKQKENVEKKRLAAIKSKRKRERKAMELSKTVKFEAIDFLYDPNSLALEILDRIYKKKDSFILRLSLLNLLSRLIGRHRLLIFGFYSYLNKFMVSHQKNVSQIMAILVQGIHDLIPPHEIFSTINTIVQNFVSESHRSEVMVLGINTLREIASRAPLAIPQEVLAEILEFLNHRDKGVNVACRSLMNVYRETYPLLLPRKLRGKEACLALSKDLASKPVFGDIDSRASDKIALGANLCNLSLTEEIWSSEDVKKVHQKIAGAVTSDLNKKHSQVANGDISCHFEFSEDADQCSKSGKAENEGDVSGSGKEKTGGQICRTEDEDSEIEDEGSENEDSGTEGGNSGIEDEDSGNEEDEVAESENEENEDGNSEIGNCEVSENSDDDDDDTSFNRRKNKRQKSEVDSTSEDEYTHSLTTNVGDTVDASVLSCSTKKRKLNREERIRILRDSKIDSKGEKRDSKNLRKRNQTKTLATDGRDSKGKLNYKKTLLASAHGGLSLFSCPNVVKARNKPIMMTKQSRKARYKRNMTSVAKVAKLRTHLKNLKKKTGAKVRRRRM